MKKHNLIKLLFFLAIMTGCQSYEIDNIASKRKVQLSYEELLSIRYTEEPELKQTEIFSLLDTFQKNKSNTNTRSQLYPISFKIKEKYYLNNYINNRNLNTNEEHIPIYKIELCSESNKGLAIVSGDRRAPHVLAYIEKIKEDQDSLSTSSNALLQWGEMHIRNEIIKFNETKDSLYESAISKITKELNIEPRNINYSTIKNNVTIENNITSRSKPIEEVPSNLKVKFAIFPMCPVTWAQWEPYNCMLPKANCEKFGPGWSEFTNYPTGSGPIVVAHLLAALEPSMPLSLNINWEYLTENKIIKAPDYFTTGDPLNKREMVGRLFKNIYERTNSQPVKNSKGIVTGSSCTISDIQTYLKDYFNYSKVTSWNLNTIKNSIKAMRPVIVYGKPDNKEANGVTPFILDGLKECFGRIDNVPSDVDVCYLHANFCFGNGYQDGYYLIDIKTNTVTFETTIPLIFKDNAMSIIPDIRKK